MGGEEIEIVDGDIYVDGKLARKTLDEFMGMRVLVFDNDFAPEPDGGKSAGNIEPEYDGPILPNQPLVLDGRTAPQKLTYRHFSLDERKCLPITDEYAYNGGRRRSEPVHDFMVEADVEIARAGERWDSL